MSEFRERINKLSPKQLALLALELNDKVEAQGRREHEPIAVVGMGCRFPGGVDSPDSFWDLLAEGRDAIREVPGDRWDIDAYFDANPDVPGRMSVRNGGFLDRVDEFDPAFFGIAPREALTMDPQQRLLLEVTWEALEHAGIAADRLTGTPTGVFIGICNSDHFQRLVHRGPEVIDAYLASGSAHSVAAGRISYALGLQGPSLAVDTACSSSLVALHLACKSLRNGETSMALCGGVNVMCSPETTIALTKAHMLAPDGRCKTFDAAADGFSRGEGCGVLVLKRLSDALSNNDRIFALIRGTAANQDGRSGGLTVPNGPAQEAVIRAALADARVEPSDIAYVEAHGTGTSLGDPIEVRALARALGAGRKSNDPILIGSVKTNIGHLESAAGIAGVMKVILSLMHEQIPPHLHFREPNPHIAWSEYPVSVTAQGRAWPRTERQRLAGVSSFGFSGTNAHAILEEAPMVAAPQSKAERRPLCCIPLSARSDDALARLAKRYVGALAQQNDSSISEISHTAGSGRSHFDQRLAVVADSDETARGALQAFLDGKSHPALQSGAATPGAPPEVVFLFTGQGAQYRGMGRRLYDTSPVFRDVIDRCDALIGEDAQGRTLKSVMWSSPGDESLQETVWTQPALFALEYGLAQLWRSWGVEPAAAIGHSVGEYVAACVAGVFSLEDGLRLICERGRLMQSLPPGGAMAALFAPLDAVSTAIASMADHIAIAAINAPEHVVVSGDSEAVGAVVREFAERGVQAHALRVSAAFHSPLVSPVMNAMEECAAKFTMQAPRIPVAWNVTGGELSSGQIPDPGYWRCHLREPVRFADGVSYLHQQGYRTFLEVGPHPTLTALAQQCISDESTLFLSSLRRDKDDLAEILQGLAKLYVRGAQIDWNGVDKPYEKRRVSLPTYPFERRSYWQELDLSPVSAPQVASRSANPLCAERLSTAAPIFECKLRPDLPWYLAEHRIRDAVLVAGPVYLEMAQACGSEAFGPALRAIDSFRIHAPLVLDDKGRVAQLSFGEAAAGTTPFSIHSRPVESNGEWQLHVTGKLTEVGVSESSVGGPAIAVAAIKKRLGPAISGTEFYDRLAGLGITIGAGFRSIQEAYRADREALALVKCPAACREDAIAWAHPALVDGAFQAGGLAIPNAGEMESVYLLVEVEGIELATPLPATIWCHAVIRDAAESLPNEWRVDVTLYSERGSAVGSIRGLCMRRASPETLDHIARAKAQRGSENLHYKIVWQPSPVVPSAATSLSALKDQASQIQKKFADLAAQHGLSIYDALLPELDRLSIEYIAHALRKLGFDETIGRAFGVEAEQAQLGIIPRYTRLFARMIEMLLQDGYLERHQGGVRMVRRLPASDPARSSQVLLERFGDVDGELRTLQRCAAKLERVLTGQQDPLHLLFPDGSLTEARKLYVESPYARTYNATLAEALSSAIAKLAEGTKLQILEIGAGTGGTTTHLLPILPADHVDYTFTDISPLFLERAAEQFAQFPFLHTAALDIEKDPQAQGFKAGEYDIIVAANVLHATSDLRAAVRHAGTLLAPNGLLLMLEGVQPERWVDLTFGLTEGWWRFVDLKLRKDYPLIGRQAWHDLLEDLGFTDVLFVPGDIADSRSKAQQTVIAARAPYVPEQWTIVGDGNGVGTALAGLLRERGDTVDLLDADVDPTQIAADRFGHVVYLGALALAGQDADDATAVARCKALSCEVPMRWLARATQISESARVWLVTQGAQPVEGAQSSSSRWQAPMWGLGRVFALEQPNLWGGLVDLPADENAGKLAMTLFAALKAGGDEDQTAWRDGVRLVPRLLPDAHPRQSSFRLRPDATYLVTGGFGGLGLLVGRWMAELGARHIALLGRHPDHASEGVRAIERLGATVISLEGDVADEPAMKSLMERLAKTAPPLRGIVHAAADFSSDLIPALTPAQIESMLRPKIDGTCILQRLTVEEDLDFLVLFSSSTAILGASGFAHYAAANAFLDATAAAADQRRRRVLSVNWGTWETMRLASREMQSSFRQSGLNPISTDEALKALAQLLAGTSPQAIVANIDWTVLKPLHEARRVRPLLSNVGSPVKEASAAGSRREAPSASALIQQFDRLGPEERRDLLLNFVRREAVAVLGLNDGESVPIDRGLFEMGMDSLMSVELRRRLERGIGQSLPSTLTFNYPNIAALATFIEGVLRKAGPQETAPKLTDGIVSDGESLSKMTDAELEARMAALLEKVR